MRMSENIDRGRKGGRREVKPFFQETTRRTRTDIVIDYVRGHVGKVLSIDCDKRVSEIANICHTYSTPFSCCNCVCGLLTELVII